MGQGVHFTTQATRDIRARTYGTNSYLPSSISVMMAQGIDEEFHARFSALARGYRYIILNQSLRSALLASRATWCYRPLNIELMQKAADFLIGEHDFTSFRSSRCESNTPMRNM